MNLRIQLIARILLVGIICSSAGAVYVLHQTNQQSILEAEQTSLRIEKQLRQQLLQMFKRNDFSIRFPDVDLWQQIKGVPGSCVQFLSRSQSRQRSFCNDNSDTEPDFPQWFGHIYQQFFQPDFEVNRHVHFNAISYGTVVVSLNVQTQTARAWNTLSAVMRLMSIMLIAFSALMFITLYRMLKPAQEIVAGLNEMREGNLDIRLPAFDVTEWKQTSAAINELASAQQNTIAENQKLALKLINAQEEEHRYISRELHDEFGQCLAGIKAVSASIQQTGQQNCPEIVQDTKSINAITDHMMTALRNLLTRLRPADVDDMGLEESLKKLIKSWNQRNRDITHYQLNINGDISRIHEPLPVNIYRIIQESLTNIAKHANAKNAYVELTFVSEETLSIDVHDDGHSEEVAIEYGRGMGLLGINERVGALGGSVTFKTKTDGGFSMSVNLPCKPQFS